MKSTRKILKNFNRLFVVLFLIAVVPLSAQNTSNKFLQNTSNKSFKKSSTVFVAPPTGEREIDRASIETALEEVKSGGTIQFAAGTYLIGGQIFKITVPKINILGHSGGTILRGCDPGEFPMEDSTEFGNNCNGFELATGGQTVRNLTFEKFFWALHVGCCWDSRPGFKPGEGGQLIEDNIFRNNRVAVRVHGYWAEPTVIRNNRFVNNWHSATIYGNTAHILNNIISAPEPEEVQLLGFPGDGIHLGPPMDLHESVEGVMRSCENNVVAGNFIDGVTEGIMMSADDPEIICRNNKIRNNTIVIRRAHPPKMPEFISVHDETDSTVVGVPLALRGPIEDNLIEENVIRGAEGLAIEIRGASNNRIVNNMITNVDRRKPFPGNAIVALPIIGGDPEAWREANGSGIWLSPGSDGNEITGNSFENIASYAVYIEGDNNRLEVRKAGDSLRDLGTGNRHSSSDTVGSDAGSLSLTDFDTPNTTTFQEMHNSAFYTDTTKVLSAANTFLKAFNNLEWETFYNSFSPSATVFQPFGNPFRHNNREELAEFFKSFFSQIKSTTEGPPYLTISPQDLRIQMIDEAAVVSFHLPGDNVGRRTLVFSRNGSNQAWQIAHLHASSLEKPGEKSTGMPISQELDPKMAKHYTGRYRLTSEDMKLTVTIKAGERGLQAEIGDYKSELRYVGGHTFKEEKTGYLFVFNVMKEDRATGITGLPPELDRVEVFELIEK